MKPFLFIKDSKFDTVREIIDEFPINFRNYYQPFLGDASVFFNLYNRKRVFGKGFLSDSNRDLVNCYLHVKDNPEHVKKMLLHCFERNSAEFYKAMRENVRNPSSYIYCNRASHGVMGPEWDKRYFEFNKRKISGELPSIDRCSAYMLRWCERIDVCTWQMAIDARIERDDLVYLDPPSVWGDSRGNISFVPGGFNQSDCIYMRNLAKVLSGKGTHVFLTNNINVATTLVWGEPLKQLSDGQGLWRF